MQELPVFEIRGRSLATAITYVIIGILILVASFIIISYVGNLEFGHILFIMFIIFTIEILISYLAYRTFIIKKVRIDEIYFYLYYGYELKKRIALMDIIKISRSKISWPQMPPLFLFYNFIKISYREEGKFKSCIITEDLFPKRDLTIIFNEFRKHTKSHKVPIIEPEYMGEPYY